MWGGVLVRRLQVFSNGYLTIIPFALVGYEMVGYNQSHIQQARME